MKALYSQNVTVCDMYGISGFNIVAQECRYEQGMHVFEEYAYMEIIDPETGQVLPEGERGEIVLTHLNKTAMPCIRFRTGDLSVKKRVECGCGKSLSLPDGVFGRTTEMHRVKGLKFYPSQVAFVLAGLQGVSARDYTVVISRPEGQTDHVALQVKGDPAGVDVESLRERLRHRLLFTVDEITVQQDLAEGIKVNDQRGGIDR
jgi:phenylacetate-CoA ligase